MKSLTFEPGLTGPISVPIIVFQSPSDFTYYIIHAVTLVRQGPLAVYM